MTLAAPSYDGVTLGTDPGVVNVATAMLPLPAPLMPTALLVSKPIAPPWTDSNKNLVRDLARAFTRYRPRVMVPQGRALDGVESVAVYQSLGAYAPSRAANARVLAYLLAGPRADLWHFFFAPNPLTLRAGSLASRIRRVGTVHTLASAPDNLESVAPSLFADAVVVLSTHTRDRLAAVGVTSTVIAPALGAVTVSAEAIARARTRHGLPERYALYAGDLEHSNGAETFLAAAAHAPDLGWVVAARPKTARAAEALRGLQDRARSLGVAVRFLGELDDILAVVAGALVNTLVVDTLHAKMDYPLVLLEAMRLGVPVVVGAGTAAEALTAGGAVAVAPGDAAGLATVVQSLADDAARRSALGDAGRAWVEAHCAPAVVAAAYEAVYDGVLARRR